MKPHEAPTRQQVDDRKYGPEREMLIKHWMSVFEETILDNGIDPGETDEVNCGNTCVAGDVGRTEGIALNAFLQRLKNDGWQDVSYKLEPLHESGHLDDDGWKKTRRHLIVSVKRPEEEPVVRRGDYGI